MFGDFSEFIIHSGQTFSIVRDNVKINDKVKGIFNTEKSSSKPYIGFAPESDIKANDILINKSEEKFYITDVKTQFIDDSPFQIKAYYLSEIEYINYIKDKPSSAPTFNINAAYGSVIGTQNSATVNYSSTIHEMKEQVNSLNSDDKEDLQKIISLLEMITQNELPVQQGIFSRFAEVIQRNSWVTGSITSVLLNWLITQPH